MVSDVNLTFDKVTIRVVDVPLRRPIVGAVGQYASWPFVLIDVATKEGVVGRSYLEPYLVDSCKYIVPAIEAAAETLTDRPVAPVENLQRVIGGLHLHGRQGVTLIAAAALDMAMWDALAQAAGMPLAVLLGGTIGRVRSYNTNGLWLIPVKDLAKQAAELVDEGGFSAIKMRLGRETLKDDLAALAEVRGAIGEEIHIMSDFNQGLTVAEALHRLHSLDDMGLYWFEEPITFDDLHHCAQLTSQLKTPVQIGENLYGPRDFYSAVKLGAADLYMPDLMRIGGVTGFMRCASIAGAAGIPLSNHLYPEFSAHLLRASETADWLEWRDWGNSLLREPFELDAGFTVVPNRPGAGIEWNEKAVRRYQVR